MASDAFVTSRPRALDRASWGAIFAGFFIGIGVLFMLLVLGAAVGFTSVDPRDLSSWKAVGVGMGVWGGISMIISSFVAAWVTARLSTAQDRAGGVLHGAAVWGFTWAAALWVGAMALGAAARGTAAAAGGVAAKAGAAAQGADTSVLTRQLSDQVNAWLREHGKPAVPPDQMQRTLSDVAQQALAAVRQGRSPADAIDRETLAGTVAHDTNLSRADAQQLASLLQERLRQTAAQLQEMAGKAGETAATGGAAGMWGAFVAALLTLVSSIVGGALGVPERARREVERRRELPTGPLPQRA